MGWKERWGEKGTKGKMRRAKLPDFFNMFSNPRASMCF